MDDISAARREATHVRVPLRTAAVVGLIGTLATGCMTTKVDETRQVAAAIQANESIVLLKKPQLEGVGTEEVFLDCVQERLGGQLVHPESGQNGRASTAKVPFKIYGEQEFTDAMFPWFEPSTAPANAAGLRVLLRRPGVTERLQEIGVRYVVWLDGNTKKTDGGGSVACAAGPGGAACIGVGWWEKESGYVASVWDMQNATEIGTVTADVTGTSVLIGAVAPIPIISPVRRKACDRLSEQLRSFLAGDDMHLAVPASAATTEPAIGGGGAGGAGGGAH